MIVTAWQCLFVGLHHICMSVSTLFTFFLPPFFFYLFLPVTVSTCNRGLDFLGLFIVGIIICDASYMLVVPTCMFLSLILTWMFAFFVFFFTFYVVFVAMLTYIRAQLVMIGVQFVEYILCDDCNSVEEPVCWVLSYMYVCFYFFYLFFTFLPVTVSTCNRDLDWYI